MNLCLIRYLPMHKQKYENCNIIAISAIILIHYFKNIKKLNFAILQTKTTKEKKALKPGKKVLTFLSVMVSMARMALGQQIHKIHIILPSLSARIVTAQ